MELLHLSNYTISNHYELCSMPLYCVVEFIDETYDGQSVVDIIPTCWMTEEQNECFWPSGRNVTKAVKDRQKPEESWPKYSIRVLGWAGKRFFSEFDKYSVCHLSSSMSIRHQFL